MSSAACEEVGVLRSWTGCVMAMALILCACGKDEPLPEDCDAPCGVPVQPVQTFEATAGSGEVELVWEVPDGAAGVMIRRTAGESIRDATDGELVYDGLDTSFLDTGVVNFTTYNYRPFSYDAEGEFASGFAAAQVTPMFDAMTSLSAAAQPGEVSLRWDVPNGAVGVKIRRATGRTEDEAEASTEVYDGAGTSFVDADVTDHTVYSYFAVAYDEDGTEHPDTVFDQIRPPGWAKVAAGDEHSLAIAQDGSLWAWGRNEWSQLGFATTKLCVYYSSGVEFETPCAEAPRQVGTATDWVDVAGGGAHSLGVRADGTLWGWGWSQYGQAGGPSSVDAPTQIGTDTTWTRVAAGDTHSLALQSDGSLWAFGNGGWGQVGLGLGGGGSTPQMVTAAQPWSEFDAEGDRSIGLQADGTMWAWGRNGGYLVAGIPDDILTPAQVGTKTDWSVVAMGGGFVAALGQDGSLWAWGPGPGPNIASGSPVDTMVPLPVGSDDDWGALFAGSGHVLALKENGKLWAWGRNYDGQLGNGGGGDVVDPTAIGELTWATLAGGAFHSLGITAGDGKLWAWGDGVMGQLGLGQQGGGLESPYLVP